jgi:tetratricopeptide (TPR) repeat protein
VPVNLRDCPPFASRHRPDLGAEDRDAWQRAFERGAQAADEGRPDDAVAAWTEAAAIDDRHAELMYRLAVAHDELGHLSAAGYYHRARDLDVLRFRADSRINRIIRETAAEGAKTGVRLVDLAGAFARFSDGGVPGDALFYEHVHFTFSGAYLVARELLGPVLEAVTADEAADLGAVPDQPRAVEQLAFTPWDRIRVGIELGGRLRRPPFSRQLDNAEDLAALEHWIRELRGLIEREGVARSLATYRGQLAAFPDDWILHFNLGNLLLHGLGDAESAEPHHRVVVDRHPEFARGWTLLGWDLLRQGRSEEAVRAFGRSLELAPDPATMTALGTALGTDGRVDEALDILEQAVATAPDDPGASYALGVTLMRSDPDDPDIRRRARALFERTLEIDPRHEPASAALDQIDAGRTGPVATE